MFLHELALELKMTVAELTHGRGTPTSAHELAVAWPAFFRHRESERVREAKKQKEKAERDRTGRGR